MSQKAVKWIWLAWLTQNQYYTFWDVHASSNSVCCGKEL